MFVFSVMLDAIILVGVVRWLTGSWFPHAGAAVATVLCTLLGTIIASAVLPDAVQWLAPIGGGVACAFMIQLMVGERLPRAALTAGAFVVASVLVRLGLHALFSA
ncbi:MAG: hypothetical protein AB7T63_16945 [Planctomycetota bacterium]